ncbi:beta-ketoacyl-[acyl-carrier-protein] synthase family protein [Oricola cellulosilytica]|uniref:Nodulation protein E n=1 Tax=Oricola cellulosilytica TaxID=1429082 RepID=A0A4R0PDV0_9HYPH|nr:beta-ketoacyl-[acyl-carrier-protein] synthase family protein [Oricola cellulosilytica]TCD15956.1 beta-ketoacyl-[acyl-carrier-protein] synthase family protein [Oricola cellulosilytica]
MTRPRIVVTGMGGLCCLGKNTDEIWAAMRKGTCGIGPLTIPDKDDLKVSIAGEIAELPGHDLDRRQLATMGRFGLLAVLASGEALRQAGLDAGQMPEMRIGAVIGTGVYGGDAVEQSYRSVFREGKKRTDIFTVPKAMPASPSVQTSMAHGLTGPVFGVTSACSSSNHAIASAVDLLVLGRADAVVAGGSEAPLSYGVLKAWESMRILAKTGCRPFSADREGLVLGDGAGALVLETLEHANARGATILAEIAGSGFSADASDIVSPTLEGPVAAMRDCLENSGLSPEDVDYINAHGTSTQANDKIETEAIRAVFGKHADALSLSSTKSMHAHCLGASGALEAIACINAIRYGIVPPTVNYTESDPDCDLDVTPNEARRRPVSVALSNAFAFGGTNAVIAFKAA